MAAPNIVGITTVIGLTTAVSLGSTTPTRFISNAANSGKVFKINSLFVSNIDGTVSANITINHHFDAAGAGTSVSISRTVAVPANSTLIVLDKASSIYLEENRSLTATASAAGDLAVTCSYEEISS
jgi:hypothetical protein